MPRFICCVAIAATVLISAETTQAVTRDWDGFAFDNQWFSPANWNPSGTLAPADDLTIGFGTPFATNGVFVDSGLITNTGGVLFFTSLTARNNATVLIGDPTGINFPELNLSSVNSFASTIQSGASLTVDHGGFLSSTELITVANTGSVLAIIDGFADLTDLTIFNGASVQIGDANQATFPFADVLNNTTIQSGASMTVNSGIMGAHLMTSTLR